MARSISSSWYDLVTGRPLSDADIWLEQHDSPTARVLTSQRVSKILNSITEYVRQTFCKLRGEKLASGEHLCVVRPSFLFFSESESDSDSDIVKKEFIIKLQTARFLKEAP